MFCDVTAHLDVSETLDTQVCDYIDIRQIDARHAVVVFKPVGEGLDLLAEVGRVHTESRIVANLPEVEEER